MRDMLLLIQTGLFAAAGIAVTATVVTMSSIFFGRN
jgi:hypothetical protein